MRFPDERELILTDTVGFIRDLPQDLVTAFRATLEELSEADLLMHVLDASDPAMEEQRRAVEKILFELELSDKPRLLVYNKIDKLDAEGFASLPFDREAVALSAFDKETVRPLLLAIDQALALSPLRRYWVGWPGCDPSLDAVPAGEGEGEVGEADAEPSLGEDRTTV